MDGWTEQQNMYFIYVRRNWLDYNLTNLDSLDEILQSAGHHRGQTVVPDELLP